MDLLAVFSFLCRHFARTYEKGEKNAYQLLMHQSTKALNGSGITCPLWIKEFLLPHDKNEKKMMALKKKKKIGARVFQMLLRCGSGVMMWNPNLAPTRGVGGRINPQCAGSGRSTHASPLRRALSCWKKMSDRQEGGFVRHVAPNTA